MTFDYLQKKKCNKDQLTRNVCTKLPIFRRFKQIFNFGFAGHASAGISVFFPTHLTLRVKEGNGGQRAMGVTHTTTKHYMRPTRKQRP